MRLQHLKNLIVGDRGIGKTTFLMRLLEKIPYIPAASLMTYPSTNNDPHGNPVYHYMGLNNTTGKMPELELTVVDMQVTGGDDACGFICRNPTDTISGEGVEGLDNLLSQLAMFTPSIELIVLDEPGLLASHHSKYCHYLERIFAPNCDKQVVATADVAHLASSALYRELIATASERPDVVVHQIHARNRNHILLNQLVDDDWQSD